MKTTYWITGALVLAMGTAGIAAAQGPGGKAQGTARGAALFERFDTDGDGRVTESEMETLRTERFAAADADGDGFLTPDEMAAHAEAMREERRMARLARMVEQHDTDGDGRLSAAEAAASGPARMFERLDADEDGAITREEMAQMRGGMRGMHADGEHRGHGQGRDGHGMPWWMR